MKRKEVYRCNSFDYSRKEYGECQSRYSSYHSVSVKLVFFQIDAVYGKGVEKLSKAKAKHCVTTSDLTRIICKLTPDLIIGTTTKKDPYTKKVSQGFIFDAVKLQDQELYSEDFAQFLYELEYFKKLGCNCNSMIEYTGSDIKIIYYIPVSSFSVVTSMVDDWINYTAKKAFYSVLAKEDFESRFEADLQAHTANIKEEIESRGK